MMKYEAIGVIETQYFAVASEILDHVSKTSDVHFLSSQNYLGGKLVSIIVGGAISDVKVAIDAAKQMNERLTNHPIKNAVVITNPHPEILKFVIPQQKTRKKKQSSKKSSTKKQTKKTSTK